MTSSSSTSDSSQSTPSVDSPLIDSKEIIIGLSVLVVIFMLGILCLQGFGLVFLNIGEDLHAGTSAALISAIPGILLGISCFIYGSLGDFISLRGLVWFGVASLLIGSICGFLWHENLFLVIIWRSLQTLGYQAAASAAMVMASKYLSPKKKIIFFGFFTGSYQAASAIGVICAGFLVSISWAYLFLIPLLAILVIPFLFKSIPKLTFKSVRFDFIGFGIFSAAVLLLTLFFTQRFWEEIVASLVLFVIFGFYIAKAKNPFLPPSFFKNKRWLAAIVLFCFFYIPEWALLPTYNAIGENVLHISSARVSLLILPAFVVAAISSISAGWVISRIGKTISMIVSSCLLIFGCLLYAFYGVHSEVGIVIATSVLGLAYGQCYPVIYDTTLDSLPISESGRGVGLNDFSLVAFASIGVSLLTPLIPGVSLSHVSFIKDISHLQGDALLHASNLSNLFLIYGAVFAVGLIWVLIFWKLLYKSKSRAHVTDEQKQNSSDSPQSSSQSSSLQEEEIEAMDVNPVGEM